MACAGAYYAVCEREYLPASRGSARVGVTGTPAPWPEPGPLHGARRTQEGALGPGGAGRRSAQSCGTPTGGSIRGNFQTVRCVQIVQNRGRNGGSAESRRGRGEPRAQKETGRCSRSGPSARARTAPFRAQQQRADGTSAEARTAAGRPKRAPVELANTGASMHGHDLIAGDGRRARESRLTWRRAVAGRLDGLGSARVFQQVDERELAGCRGDRWGGFPRRV
jgi:hypothetical protein